jgi:hypothetical protein
MDEPLFAQTFYYNEDMVCEVIEVDQSQSFICLKG